MKRAMMLAACFVLLACNDSDHKEDSKPVGANEVISEEFVLSLDNKPVQEVVRILAENGSLAKVSDVEDVLVQLDEKYSFECARVCRVGRR